MSHKPRTPRQLAAQQRRRAAQLADLLAGSDGQPGSAAGVQQRAAGRRSNPARSAALLPIDVPADIDAVAIPPEVRQLIGHTQQRIQAFQDCWDQPQIEQFVASDHELVYRVLAWLVDHRMLGGRRMLEWGCGFAVIASLASRLGLDVTGIEAESRLLDQARQTVADFGSPVELVQGNFLPPGAERLSRRADFPSLGHGGPCAYQQMAADLDDFSLVFAYPWPGEWEFHEAVFAHYGAGGALLVLFCGPYDIRIWRRQG